VLLLKILARKDSERRLKEIHFHKKLLIYCISYTTSKLERCIPRL